MDYRDERDALRARAEGLEADLAAAKGELERMRAAEKALAAAQKENERLKAEVKRLRPNRPRSNATALVVAGGLVAVSVAGAVFLVLARAPRPVQTAPLFEMPPKKVVEGPAPTAEPEASPRAASVEWAGTVMHAEGLPFPDDTKCTVRAVAKTDGTKTLAPEVDVACSGKMLYSSRDPLEGMSSSSYRIEEVPGVEPGSYRVALSYQDSGTRTGERTQASVSTFDGVVLAWRDTAPAYKVQIKVDELSSSWKGPALFVEDEVRQPAFRVPVRRIGRTVAVNGNALLSPQAACAVDVRPMFGDDTQNCRVTVRCGMATIYGEDARGFGQCSVEGTRVLTAKDVNPSSTDRDPMVTVDLPRGTVEVSDDKPNAWSVKVALDPEKR